MRPSPYLRNFLLFSLLMQSFLVPAQNKARFVAGRFSLDNDFLNFRGEGTDRDYTNGLEFAVFYRRLGPWFTEKILPRLTDTAENLYACSLTQKIFTPDDISNPEIQYNDRPYAACLYLTNSLASADAQKGRRLSCGFSLGILGKYALGEQSQNFLHDLIHYKEAKGWKNQIATDIILNYRLQYEQLLASPSPAADIIGSVQGNVGTLCNNMGVGILIRAGLLNNHFINDRAAARGPKTLHEYSRFHLFGFMQTTGFVVMDDATLEGGFFTHNQSPYTIDKDDIKRLCLWYQIGFTIEKMPFRLIVSETVRTAQFKNEYAQQIGTVSVRFGL